MSEKVVAPYRKLSVFLILFLCPIVLVVEVMIELRLIKYLHVVSSLLYSISNAF